MAWKLLGNLEILVLGICILGKPLGEFLIGTPFSHSQKSHYCLVHSVYLHNQMDLVIITVLSPECAVSCTFLAFLAAFPGTLHGWLKIFPQALLCPAIVCVSCTEHDRCPHPQIIVAPSPPDERAATM